MEKQRKISEKSLQNLKPYPKGVSGNVKGRTKGVRNKSTILQEAMMMEGFKQEEPYLWYALQKIKLVKNSKSDAVKSKAIEELMDRFVGPVEKTIRHGKTPDELKAIGEDIIGLFDDIEDAEYNDIGDKQE